MPIRIIAAVEHRNIALALVWISGTARDPRQHIQRSAQRADHLQRARREPDTSGSQALDERYIRADDPEGRK